MYSEKEAMQSRGCCFVPSADQKNENINQHSCCKLDAYDWLSDINFIEEKRYFDIVEVRFKNNRKGFFRSPEGETLLSGDIVAVEASPGHDIGIVSLTGEIVRLQMHKKKVPYKDTYISKVYRKARGNDIEKWVQAAALEIPSMITTRKAVMDLGLDMKINDVEYQGDKTKAVFYYTAEGRVDFRELIKILADKFSVRIEMKQIGVRNPQKLAGQCGKLKCCLNFEQDNYKEESAKFPPSDVKLKTKAGDAFFQKKDILSGMMWYSYYETPSVFIQLRRQEVQNIQRMNDKGKLPDALNTQLEAELEGSIKFDNVIGQDDVTRFDKVKTGNSKGNSKRNGNRNKSNNKNRNQSNNKNAKTQDNKEGNKSAKDNNNKAKANNSKNNNRNNAKDNNPKQQQRSRSARPNNKNNKVNKSNKPKAKRENKPQVNKGEKS
ncbi:MAG: hypothetical protein B6I18_02920 [Bacteroidetes bacterium 4572_112]|nr:MAG: hypothetical protein B6I18_02920 [Bacteroidetes bacterium 4572_112]